MSNFNDGYIVGMAYRLTNTSISALFEISVKVRTDKILVFRFGKISAKFW